MKMYYSKYNIEKISKVGGKFRENSDSDRRNGNKKLNKPNRNKNKRNYED